MLGWADHYLLSIANPPPSPPVSPDLLIQPPVIGGSGAPKVPKRRPQMPSAVVTPTEWEKEFLEKNRDEIYDLLLVCIELTIEFMCYSFVGCQLLGCKEIDGYTVWYCGWLDQR